MTMFAVNAGHYGAVSSRRCSLWLHSRQRYRRSLPAERPTLENQGNEEKTRTDQLTLFSTVLIRYISCTIQ